MVEVVPTSFCASPSSTWLRTHLRAQCPESDSLLLHIHQGLTAHSAHSIDEAYEQSCLCFPLNFTGYACLVPKIAQLDDVHT